MIDKAHPAALESERSKFGIGDFEEDIDNGISEAANLEFFHE
jgi:hypothetical protein